MERAHGLTDVNQERLVEITAVFTAVFMNFSDK